MRLRATRLSAVSNGESNPFSRASLDLRFAGATALDPRITFTRASNATVTNSDGVLAYAPHNLLTFSEQFDNAAWGNSGATVAANTTTAPDGTLTADKVVETAAAGQHVLFRSSTVVANTIHTASGYFKSAERTRINFRLLNGSFTSGAVVTFDLSNGTVVSSSVSGTGSSLSSAITPAGDGWYRCSVSCIVDSSSTAVIWGAYLVNTGNSDSYTGDGTSGLNVWGAQLNVGPLQPYYPTTAAAYQGPRFDYDPVTLLPKGLLIEEQRTNLQVNSADFTSVDWNKGGNTTITANTSVSPAGTLTADTFGFTAITPGNCQVSDTQTKAASAITYTGSFFVKATAGLFLHFFVDANGTSNSGRLIVNTTNWTVSSITNFGTFTGTSGTVTSVGNGWYRITCTTTSGTETNIRFNLYWSKFDNGVTFTPSGAEQVFIWGAQLEAGAFATSYIPTTTAAATRAADIAAITGTNFSSWFNAAAGTLFAEWNAFGSNYNRSVVDIEQTAAATDRIDIAINSSNVINPKTVVGGSAVASLNGGNYTANTTARLAFAYASANYASSLNGAAAVTATTAGALPSSLAKMFIGSLSGISGQQINGHIRRITYFPQRLPDHISQRITQ